MDGILKKEQDNPSIGLLLCKSKNNVVAEYSLKDISKPIGVSEYKITSSLPDDLEKIFRGGLSKAIRVRVRICI